MDSFILKKYSRRNIYPVIGNKVMDNDLIEKDIDEYDDIDSEINDLPIVRKNNGTYIPSISIKNNCINMPDSTKKIFRPGGFIEKIRGECGD
ncbi:MAG TPA: hypothetical protein VLB82_06810 [Thermodesulfobacteriota bacterium]|nr:hypothetical protein [Thermodesulfobacteriota bacterium]